MRAELDGLLCSDLNRSPPPSAIPPSQPRTLSTFLQLVKTNERGNWMAGVDLIEDLQSSLAAVDEDELEELELSEDSEPEGE